MNRKLLVASSLLTVALLVSLSIAAAVCIPADNGGNSSEVSPTTVSTSFEFSPEAYGLSDEDMTLFADGISELEASDSYLYVYLNEDKQVDAEITSTTDSGRNGVENLWNGWRIYLSSEVIHMIVSEGSTASVIASFVPGLSLLGPSIIQVLRVSIYTAAQNYLGVDLLSDDYGGMYFDITYKEKRKILWFTLTINHSPRISGAGFQ